MKWSPLIPTRYSGRGMTNEVKSPYSHQPFWMWNYKWSEVPLFPPAILDGELLMKWSPLIPTSHSGQGITNEVKSPYSHQPFWTESYKWSEVPLFLPAILDRELQMKWSPLIPTSHSGQGVTNEVKSPYSYQPFWTGNYKWSEVPLFLLAILDRELQMKWNPLIPTSHSGQGVTNEVKSPYSHQPFWTGSYKWSEVPLFLPAILDRELQMKWSPLIPTSHSGQWVTNEVKSPYSHQPFWTGSYKWSEVPLFPPAILDSELQMKWSPLIPTSHSGQGVTNEVKSPYSHQPFWTWRYKWSEVPLFPPAILDMELQMKWSPLIPTSHSGQGVTNEVKSPYSYRPFWTGSYKWSEVPLFLSAILDMELQMKWSPLIPTSHSGQGVTNEVKSSYSNQPFWTGSYKWSEIPLFLPAILDRELQMKWSPLIPTSHSGQGVTNEVKSPYSYQPFWTGSYKWSEVPLFPPAILDRELQMKWSPLIPTSHSGQGVTNEVKSPYSYQPFWTGSYKWSEVPLFPPAILDRELQMKWNPLIPTSHSGQGVTNEVKSPYSHQPFWTGSYKWSEVPLFLPAILDRELQMKWSPLIPTSHSGQGVTNEVKSPYSHQPFWTGSYKWSEVPLFPPAILDRELQMKWSPLIPTSYSGQGVTNEVKSPYSYLPFWTGSYKWSEVPLFPPAILGRELQMMWSPLIPTSHSGQGIINEVKSPYSHQLFWTESC